MFAGNQQRDLIGPVSEDEQEAWGAMGEELAPLPPEWLKVENDILMLWSDEAPPIPVEMAVMLCLNCLVYASDSIYTAPF